MFQKLRGYQELDDEHIDHAQGLLKQQFPTISGWQSMSVLTVACSNILGTPNSPWVQILHIPERHHWVCATSIGCQRGQVKIYDSYLPIEPSLPSHLQQKLATIVFTDAEEMEVLWMDTARQPNTRDCGIYSIAAATALCLQVDPSECGWHSANQMRNHLITCFVMGEMSEFPHLYSSRRIPRPPLQETIPLVCHCRQPVTNKSMIRCTGCTKQVHINCDRKIKLNSLCTICTK